MKRFLTFSILLLTYFTSSAYDKDSVVYYPLPDSVKAVSFLAEISVGTITTKKEVFAGIKTDVVKLSLESEDRKSTRLNSSHSQISYAVFCLKKKNNKSSTTKKLCTSILT